MPFNAHDIESSGRDKLKENKQYFARLKRRKPKQLDQTVEALHEETFEEIDCLQCANCCKTTGPLFTQRDIERIAKHLKLRPADFVTQYLRVDEDEDYVLQQLPCPFLGTDNYCSIYEVRPQACAEYPHTDRKKFHQILDLTLKNTLICPAAQRVVERLKAELPI